MGIQFGAGGDSAVAELAAEGTLDASWAIRRARACLDAGAPIVMVESEGEGGACGPRVAGGPFRQAHASLGCCGLRSRAQV